MVGHKIDNFYKIYINLPNLFEEASLLINNCELKEYNYNLQEIMLTFLIEIAWH